MSTGSNAIPLLKSAPEPDQLADRLDGGGWRGIELALMPPHVASDDAVARAVDATRAVSANLAITAEAPVAWPSGAFVRVDCLDDEARAGIERSAEFAARVGSPVLTVHLFIPLSPDEFRRAGPVDNDAVEEFLRFYASACTSRRVTPLIENVPPILRMRTGGIFLSPIGGHWRDLLEWRERIPDLRFTIDTSHAALFRSFVVVYPGLFGLESAEHLELERFVGRRVLITGGGGSIGGALATFLGGFRPDRIVLADGHESSLIADRRARDPQTLDRFHHVLCDIREPGRLERELAAAKPDVVFHLAAYKHVDWAEVFPEEFVDTNLHGSWNVLRAAEAAGVDTVVV